MQSLLCYLCYARFTMQALPCNSCQAIFAMKYVLEICCYAIFTMQSLPYNLCCAIFAMQSSQAYLEGIHCCAIFAMQSSQAYLEPTLLTSLCFWKTDIQRQLLYKPSENPSSAATCLGNKYIHVHRSVHMYHIGRCICIYIYIYVHVYVYIHTWAKLYTACA